MKAASRRLIAATLTLLMLFACMCGARAEFAVPCIDGPYDYEHRANDKQILIRRYEEDGTVFFVCDIQISSADGFGVALSSDKANGHEEAVSEIAARNGATFAINCDDYGVHNYGIIIRNGEGIRARKTTRHMLIVDRDGDFVVHTDRSKDDPKDLSQKLLAAGVRHTFEFGPELIRNGEPVSIPKDFDLVATKSTAVEPRTAIGQIGKLHYVVIVADGRQKYYSKGLSLEELQELFRRFGAKTAMNLDGGGSTTLWFEGKVINSPSGDDERGVTDIIYF